MGVVRRGGRRAGGQPEGRVLTRTLGHSADVVVVGGGVMGSAAAWALARRGVEVVLLEQLGPGHELGTWHGRTHSSRTRSYRTAAAEPRHAALAAEARELWAQLAGESGTAVLATGAGVATAAAVGRPRLHELAVAWQRAGVDVEWLSPAQAAERWPGLRFPGPVLHGPDAVGRIDVGTAVTALQTAATARGAVALFRPVSPEPAWPASSSAVGGLEDVTAVAVPDGVLIGFSGPGREVDPGRPTAADLARLEEHVRRWLPGLEPVADPVSCTCTSTPTGDFVLDRVGPVVVGAGFSGQGFASAPAVGRVLADLALGLPADVGARPHAVPA